MDKEQKDSKDRPKLNKKAIDFIKKLTDDLVEKKIAETKKLIQELAKKFKE